MTMLRQIDKCSYTGKVVVLRWVGRAAIITVSSMLTAGYVYKLS